MFTRVLFTFISALSVALAIGQSKATIKIQTFENGKLLSTEERELMVPEGFELSEMLDKTGIWEEFGDATENKQYSIQIEQDKKQNYADHTAGKRAQLGVMVRKSAVDKGAEITQVLPESAASKAGLEVGDIIVEIDDIEINTDRDLIDYIKTKMPGDKVNLRIKRNGKRKNIKALLTENTSPSIQRGTFGSGFPQSNSPEFYMNMDSIFIFHPKNNFWGDSIQISQPFQWNQDGFNISETPYLGITPGTNAKIEASVGSIEPGSTAEQIGLQVGDVIIALNETPVANFEELRNLVRSLTPGQNITLRVIRDGKEKNLEGTIGSKPTSSSKDFRIFHDFKGMDELGNLNYNFELDMDIQDIEKQLDQMLQELERQQQKIKERKDAIQDQLNQLEPKNNFKKHHEISIDDINEKEIESLNQKMEPKMDLSNELSFERISFFPNPSEGHVQLSFVPKDQGDVTIVLYDSNGAKIYYEMITGSFGEYTNQLDISERPNGNYYIQILQNGRSYCKKIIKTS